jgi:hypothetical protein
MKSHPSQSNPQKVPNSIFLAIKGIEILKMSGMSKSNFIDVYLE